VARRALPQDLDDKIVQHVVEQRGAINYTALGRLCLIDYRTARRRVEKLRPRIEAELAKAKITTPQSVTPAPAATAPTRAERETAVSDGTLVVAGDHLSIWRRMRPALFKLADRVQAAAAANIEQVDPTKALTLVNAASRLGDRCLKIAEVALKIERLRVGQPTEVIGVQLDDTMTVEQALAAGKALIAALEQSQLEGTQIDSGAAAEPAAQHDLGAHDPAMDWRQQSQAGTTTPSCCGSTMLEHGGSPPIWRCRVCSRRVRVQEDGTFSEMTVVIPLPLSSAS
jgi:hypothetical protein